MNKTMSKIQARERYDSMSFRVKEQESRMHDNKKEYLAQGMCMSMDLNDIQQKSESPGEFYRVTKIYFRNRPDFCKEGEDYDTTAHAYTIITMCSDIIYKGCDMLNMNPYEDTDLDVKVTRNDENVLGAQISLKIHKSVPKHKHVALNAIFDEFQQSLGSEKHSVDDVSAIDDADYDDIDIDDITEKA